MTRPQQIARIWEVFARLNVPAADAVAALDRFEGVTVPVDEAARQIEAARDRNTLCLITDRPDTGMRSNWLHRLPIF